MARPVAEVCLRHTTNKQTRAERLLLYMHSLFSVLQVYIFFKVKLSKRRSGFVQRISFSKW